MENSSQDDRERNKEPRPGMRRAGPNFWMLLVVVGVMLVFFFVTQGPSESVIPYSFFLEQLEAGNLAKVELGDQDAKGIFVNPPSAPPKYDREGKSVPQKDSKTGEPVKLNKHFRVVLPRDGDSRGKLTGQLTAKGVDYENEPQSNALMMLYMLALLGSAWHCSSSSGSPIAAHATR